MGTTGNHISASGVLLPLISAISLLLLIPPAIWHVKQRNVAAISLLFWIALSTVFLFVNALIWRTDEIEKWWDGAILCDIQAKLFWGAYVGVQTSLACIMRRLAGVVDVDKIQVNLTRAQNKRQVIVDLLWCFALPIYAMAVEYVVQSNRYVIIGISGCAASIDNSWVSVVLLLIWPPVFSLVTAYYGAAVVYRVRKHRQQFGDLMASGSGMNRSLFIRLFSMSFLLLWVFLPMQFYILATNVTFHFHAYSWSLVHGPDWWHIIMLPSGGTVHYDRWIRASLGIVVFLFFGLGTEAQKMYRGWLIRAGLDRVFPTLFQPKREDGLLVRFFNRYFGFLKRPAAYIFYRVLLGMTPPSSKNDVWSSSISSPGIPDFDKEFPDLKTHGSIPLSPLPGDSGIWNASNTATALDPGSTTLTPASTRHPDEHV